MFDKLSDLKEKSEYEKIKMDYTNNYGYNLGFSGHTNKIYKDNYDKSIKNSLIIK